ncbi:hypothetical protein BT69DRAFT_1283968 [Atractiella rhizophila]|nr:hypothetical protein BT69DRAFT_1283968 [Atractiella rhizophila]
MELDDMSPLASYPPPPRHSPPPKYTKSIPAAPKPPAVPTRKQKLSHPHISNGASILLLLIFLLVLPSFLFADKPLERLYKFFQPLFDLLGILVGTIAIIVLVGGGIWPWETASKRKEGKRKT